LNSAVFGYGTVSSGDNFNFTFTNKYNESSIKYDHNGNLTSLSRYHGNFTIVDSLQYSSYNGNLLGTIKEVSGSTSTVGFQDRNNGTNNDYQYDANGNLTFDYNKNITAITYNYLNLPNLVTIGGKGTIAYTYDAGGNKLQRTLTDQTVTPNKVTNYYYAGDFLYRNDTLEFVNHPEGRLRPVRIDTTKAISIANLKYIYDYYLKDHLGSVRTVITTDQETDIYTATLEAANATTENLLFSNISSTTVAKPTTPSPGFDSDTSNHQVSQLNGNVNISGNKRVGPSIVLKVMAGDTVSLSTYAWYAGATQGPATGVPPIANDILPLLTGGVISDNGTKGGSIPSSGINTLLSTVLNTFLTNTQDSNYNSTRPKSFLNWMIVDEEFNAVSSPNHLGAVQIPLITGSMQKQQLVGPTKMVVRRNGWLYVYVSNESNQNVFFDNLVINQTRGPVLEVNDFYPFGLQIPGSSSAALKANYNQNRYKFDGIEYDTAFGLDYNEAFYRDLDPEIGRFTQLDPSPNQSESPYSSMGNNPILNNDPLGDTIIIKFTNIGGHSSEDVYRNGGLYPRSGKNLILDNVESYSYIVAEDLNKIKSLNIKEVNDRLVTLEKSKQVHLIEMPDEDHKNGNDAESPEKDKKGIPTGSDTKFNPDDYKTARDDIRKPIVGLTHELLGHGYDSNQGKTDYRTIKSGIHMYEINAVKVENKVRKAIGEKQRTTYGGEKIPAYLLE
jgi:RHS repeat-associated protein